jgi:peroxiredoxin Q/BCP
MTRFSTIVAAAALLIACKSDKPGADKAPEPAPAPQAAPAPSPAPAESPNANLLAVGAPAPDVSGTAHDGTEISLAKLKGKPVVVYFYPKDDTPGCTVEAQAFRDSSSEFTALGAVVVGVSMDDLESHKAFAEKHQLNFPLLPDKDGAIAAKFGVNTTRGVAKRTTFVIGKDGTIVNVFPDVNVDGHSALVLAAVKEAAAK